ncbi:MAG: OmpA family protein [Cytophagaceae bacterium]|nr:OmpA family protein [Cytophagaceae bacterium]
MKNLFTLTCLFVFLALTTLSYSQYSTTNKKAIKLYEEAEAIIKSRTNYDRAIALLEEAVAKDPNFVEARLKVAGVYKLFGDSKMAKMHFEKACEIKPNSKEMAAAYYTVGEFYFNEEGDYEKAQKQLERVLAVSPTDKRLVENASTLLEKSKFGIEAKKNPVNFKPVQMSPVINKYYIHAYPVVTADQEILIFTKRDGPNADQDEDIMISKKVNGQWTDPVSLSKNINSEFNEGACTMSADGKVLVFTSCNRKDGLGACDLYVSYREGNEWSVPENLGPNVNSNVWDSEPALSADGRILYFTSERKGGYGKEDIWVTEKNEKGEWAPARNLGKDINTPGREVSPFIHANGTTLYFSSTFHPGLGGFDAFYSNFDGLSWSVPKNLGYPINTHIDNVTVYITVDNKKGYYSVYEKKDMRISKAYLFEFEVPKEIVTETHSTFAKGTIYDAETKKKLGAKIELIDLKTNKVIQSVSSDSKNGDYLIVLSEGKEYALYVQKEGYLFKSSFFDYKNPKDFNPLSLDVYLDPIKPGKAVVLNNIFFASNSFSLEEKSKTELDKIVLFLQANPNVKMEFGGHTDDVGSDKDNMDLSMKRAKAVFDYIVSKGIPATRLKFQGYGETKPMLANTSEENRQKNRRIEFKVLN